jgi:sugar/nucleoside kinase (ribokinase family)
VRLNNVTQQERMGKSSRGVVAVGRLAIGVLGAAKVEPAPSADGPALAAAVGAWLVGVDAAVCAVIGTDFPRSLILEIARAGIDTSRIQTLVPSDAMVGPDLDPVPEQLAGLSPSWAVHVCGLPSGRQREIVRSVRQRVACITLDIDVAGTVVPDLNQLLALAAECDAFLPDRTAVAQLWPGEPPRAVLRLMADAGVPAAVIKLGAGGSLGMRGGEIVSMPAFPVMADDGMDVGSVYAGAFAAMYAGDQDLRRAMAWAAAAASVVVESNVLVGKVSEFARKRVEARARVLDGKMKALAD